MKTIRLLSVLALGAFVLFACKSNNKAEEATEQAQAETAQTEAAAAIIDSAKIAAGKTFLEGFYKGYDEVFDKDIENYEFIKSNITPKMKQWLMDSYDYDCDGECMAFWLFCYEGGGDTGGLKTRTIKPEGDAYLVSCIHDQGENKEYHYTIKLTLVQDGDTFKIDNLEKIDEHYVGYDE